MNIQFTDDLIGEPTAKAPQNGEMAWTGGAYDASSLESHELALWTPPMQSADQDILPEMGVVTSRVRDVGRNDSLMRGAMLTKTDSIVGERFLLNSTPNSRILGLDEVWEEEFQEEVEAKFTLYAESLMNYPDAQRKNSLTELVRLAVGIYGVTGEVIASVEWLRDSGRPYSTALQLIENERLSTPDTEMEGRLLRGGVRRNDFGAAIGYYIRNAFPSDYLDYENVNSWTYVPATKPWGRLQMIHIIDQQRPDQTRGISNIVSALKELRMTKKYRDIVLQSAALNATYAASIESELPTDVVMAQAGGGDPKALVNFAKAYLGEIARFTKGAKNLVMNGVKIPHFYPGTTMKLQNAATPGGIGTTFEQSMLRYISASLGISYEEFSKDYAKANYSNLRAALAQTQRRSRVEKRQCADRFASLYFRLWLEEAMNKGEITSLPRKAPNWYEGMNAEAYSQCSWIGANMGQIDGLKETQAAVLRLNNGLGTAEDELAALGKDWRQVYKQLAREQKYRDRIGLVLSAENSKNMMNAASGQPSSEGDSPRSATNEDSTDE